MKRSQLRVFNRLAADLIKDEMAAERMSGNRLADLSGVPRTTVRSIISGKADCTFHYVMSLMRVLHVDLAPFYEIEINQTQWEVHSGYRRRNAHSEIIRRAKDFMMKELKLA